MKKKAFYDSIRVELFGGRLTQGVVNSVEAINHSMDKYCITDYRQRAYIFGTGFHESYHREKNPEWEPVREGFASTNQGAINAVTTLYKSGKIKTNYALPLSNGLSYYGRGFTQITWPDNYKILGAEIGVDLYNNPDKALDRAVASDIMVVGMKKGLFTGKKLSDYLTDSTTDFINCRRIINGLDQADRIAGFAEKFYLALILK